MNFLITAVMIVLAIHSPLSTPPPNSSSPIAGIAAGTPPDSVQRAGWVTHPALVALGTAGATAGITSDNPSADPSTEPSAEPASTEGYAFMAGVGATRLGRVVRMDPTTPTAVRRIMRDAVDEINAVSGAQLVIGPDTTAAPTVDEIVVRVPEVTVCGPLAAGCASNAIGTTEGIGVVTNALIEIKRDLLGSGYEIPILLHEMGHAMGLGHYDVPYGGLMQVMWNSVTPDMVAYRAGDRKGLAALTAPFANPNVIGTIDSVRQTPQGIRVIGWTLDLDDPAPALAVGSTIDLRLGASGVADLYRPDVGAAFPGAGNLHGFDMLIPTPAGEGVSNICVNAVGHRGQQMRVTCRNLTVLHRPIGHLDMARQSGPAQIRLSGWTLDPDTADSINVHIYVNGVFTQNVLANRPRPDVEIAYRGYGPNHGFALDLVNVAGGTNQVCAFGIDSQGGTNSLLGCRSVVVRSGNPIGNVEGPPASWLLPTTMTGWALDPDTAAPIAVHLYVNGRFVTAALADRPRPDVARAFPGYGEAHGFVLGLPALSPGTHTGCVFGINVGPGTTNPLIGCRSFSIPGGVPFGHVDTVRVVDSRVAVSGWTIDPDTASPIAVHVYVDGQFVTAGLADRSRPDVAVAFPGYGDAHGFTVGTGSIQPGVRTVCVFAINVATGAHNPNLGCTRVAIS